MECNNNKLDSAKVDLYIPKFTLNYSKSLSSDWRRLAGNSVWSLRADLSHISSKVGLFVPTYCIKTYVDVDEEGTEAAAVTAISVGTTVYPKTWNQVYAHRSSVYFWFASINPGRYIHWKMLILLHHKDERNGFQLWKLILWRNLLYGLFILFLRWQPAVRSWLANW